MDRMEGKPEPADSSGHFEIQIPQSLEAGVYANFLTVWHTPLEFTLDFAVLQPAQQEDPGDAASAVMVPARVVSRLKIPPAMIFRILQALNENLEHYENRFGEIKRPDEQEPS